MAWDVTHYYASCASCQATNASVHKSAGSSQPREAASAPGERWSIDFLELPVTKAGHNMCLTWTDRLTKFCILIPMRAGGDSPLSSAVTY